MRNKQEWLQKVIGLRPKADTQVLQFIADMKFRCGNENASIIEKLFSAGYCWYFAHILKLAFERGQVCYAYYENHFVWLDGISEVDDVAYDIHGVNKCWGHLIPEELLGNGIWDFKHVANMQSGMEDQEIISLLIELIENGQYAH